MLICAWVCWDLRLWFCWACSMRIWCTNRKLRRTREERPWKLWALPAHMRYCRSWRAKIAAVHRCCRGPSAGAARCVSAEMAMGCSLSAEACAMTGAGSGACTGDSHTSALQTQGPRTEPPSLCRPPGQPGILGGGPGRPPFWRTPISPRKGLGPVTLKINNQHTPPSPYTYSSSTHRFPDERKPIEATPLSATSTELGLGWGLGWGLDSLSHSSSSHALPFFSQPSFHTRWSA